jgi:hypothetical protein
MTPYDAEHDDITNGPNDPRRRRIQEDGDDDAEAPAENAEEQAEEQDEQEAGAEKEDDVQDDLCTQEAASASSAAGAVMQLPCQETASILSGAGDEDATDEVPKTLTGNQYECYDVFEALQDNEVFIKNSEQGIWLAADETQAVGVARHGKAAYDAIYCDDPVSMFIQQECSPELEGVPGPAGAGSVILSLTTALQRAEAEAAKSATMSLKVLMKYIYHLIKNIRFGTKSAPGSDYSILKGKFLTLRRVSDVGLNWHQRLEAFAAMLNKQTSVPQYRKTRQDGWAAVRKSLAPHLPPALCGVDIPEMKSGQVIIALTDQQKWELLLVLTVYRYVGDRGYTALFPMSLPLTHTLRCDRLKPLPKLCFRLLVH